MAEIADRYLRLSQNFADKIAAVPEDRWDSPSPCADWTARDVVGHVVESPGIFLRLVGREMPSLPDVADDPLGAFDGSRAVIQAGLEDPALAGMEFEGFMGRSTFEAGIDRFINFDLIVHGWDLARAAGLDETIDPDDVAWLTEAAAHFGDAMRGPQAFGAELPAPDGADDQTRLLAFLGRAV